MFALVLSLAREETRLWADAASESSQRVVPCRGYLFWHDMRASKDNRPPRLSETFRVGLLSQLKNSGLQLTLFSYQSFAELPAGVAVVSPATFGFPEDTFLEALAKGPKYLVGILSDVIILTGMVSLSGGGWRLDGDCIALRRFPLLSTDGDDFGHFFSSLDADYRQRGGKEARIKRWYCNSYLKVPGDELWLATPMAFPANSPILQAYLPWAMDFFTGVVAGVQPKSYGVSLVKLRELIISCGLEGSIRGPQVCSPLKSSANKQVITANSRPLYFAFLLVFAALRHYNQKY